MKLHKKDKNYYLLGSKDQVKALGILFRLLKPKKIRIVRSEADKKLSKEIRKHKKAFYAADRHACKLKRTPKWLTKEQKQEIMKFYALARKRSAESGIEYQVDHIIPLKGRIISGLNVPWNLQVITKSENTRKNNRFVG